MTRTDFKQIKEYAKKHKLKIADMERNAWTGDVTSIEIENKYELEQQIRLVLRALKNEAKR